MKRLVNPFISCLLVFVLTQAVDAQDQKNKFITSKSFHTTTYVEVNLPNEIDLKIKILDSKKRNTVFTKELKSIKIARFKLDLHQLEKGEYIMVFIDTSGEVLKEITTNKIK